MITTWVLIVIVNAYLGSSTVAFQEFTSQTQCEYVAGLIYKERGVSNTYCVRK
jgi:hypothetical protein